LECSQQGEVAVVAVEVVVAFPEVEVDMLSVAHPFAEAVEHIDWELPALEEPHTVLVANSKEAIRILLLDSARTEVVEIVVIVAVAAAAVNSRFVEDFDMEVDSLVGLEPAVVPSNCYTSLGLEQRRWRQYGQVDDWLNKGQFSRPSWSKSEHHDSSAYVIP
jgi:hypothetical protein